MKTLPLGRVAGLHLEAEPSALAGTIVVWIVGSGAARWLGVPRRAALPVGLALAGLHWASELWHQAGHARAARATGHPMIGVRFWTIFTGSIYPPDEPELPGAVHIRRALGGAPASAVLAGAAGLAALALRRAGPVPRALALWTFWENLLVFCLGAFLPLGFTDGSTLLHWWGRRNE